MGYIIMYVSYPLFNISFFTSTFFVLKCGHFHINFEYVCKIVEVNQFSKPIIYFFSEIDPAFDSNDHVISIPNIADPPFFFHKAGRIGLQIKLMQKKKNVYWHRGEGDALSNTFQAI